MAAALNDILDRLTARAEAQDAARDNAREEARAAEDRRSYVRKIVKADGSDLSSVRRWVREIQSVHNVRPGIAVEVARQTSNGRLFDELERLITALGQRPVAPIARADVTWDNVVQDLKITILGPEDEATLRRELCFVVQATHENVHEFASRFAAAAEDAYPQPRAVVVEEHIVRTFISGLEDSKVKEELAIRRAPATLQAASTAAREVSSRLALITDMSKNVVSEVKEDVKPPPVDNPDSIATLTKQVAKLSTALGEVKRNVKKGDGRACFNCNKKGHFVRDCRAPGGGAAVGNTNPRGRGRGGFRGRYNGGRRGRWNGNQGHWNQGSYNDQQNTQGSSGASGNA